jgi:hypothetical protein
MGSKLWKTTSALFIGDKTRSVMTTEKNTMIMYAAMNPSKRGKYLTRYTLMMYAKDVTPRMTRYECHGSG